MRARSAAGGFDVAAAAERLGMALVHDADAGPVGARSRVARRPGAGDAPRRPSWSLDDLDGNAFRLSSLRGQKVVLVSWAPY